MLNSWRNASKRLDGIQACGAACRGESEDDAHCGGEERGDGDDASLEHERHLQDQCRGKGCCQGEQDAEQAAEGGERHGFDQELHQYLARAPHSESYADLRVRSVTDTSMPFMMPVPPTSMLTEATAPSRAVSI